MKRDVKS